MAVIDASVAAAIILHLPWSAAARVAIAAEKRLLAPVVFPVEIANTIWRSVRAGQLVAGSAANALSTACAIVEIRSDDRLIESALQLALRHMHPVYDCLYLALAKAEDTVLLTADRRLVSIADAAAVSTKYFSA